MMTQDCWDKCLGALCAWREARGEGDLGMRAVLHVINNRHKTSGRGWDEEIVAKNQFSSMSILGDSQTIKYPTPTYTNHTATADPRFDSALAIAAQVYTQADPDPTNGALFYWNPDTGKSQWFVDHIVNSPEYEECAVIGHHHFYRKRG